MWPGSKLAPSTIKLYDAAIIMPPATAAKRYEKGVIDRRRIKVIKERLYHLIFPSKTCSVQRRRKKAQPLIQLILQLSTHNTTHAEHEQCSNRLVE